MNSETDDSDTITIQKTIDEAEKIIRNFIDSESDPKLRRELSRRFDLSISNFRESIETNCLVGQIIKKDDGSIDPLQSTFKSKADFLRYIRRSIEQRKADYLSHQESMNNPSSISVIYANKILGLFSIRQEWDLRALKDQLLADEAIPLMNGLDPIPWKEYKSELKPLPKDMSSSIERCLKIAEAEGTTVRTPSDWLKWGFKHGLDKVNISLATEPGYCWY